MSPHDASSTPSPKGMLAAQPKSAVYLVNARMIFAEMWRKKIEAMKERERTRTMKGSL